MAAYPPPTEDLPIFDDSVFTTANNTPLTLATASKYFLKYPNAQGDENLQSVNVAGLATFDGDINFNYNLVAQTNAYTTTTTITQGQSYLNFAGTGANSDGGVIRIQNNTSGAAVSLGATTTNGLNINRGILIGNNNTSNGLTVALTSDQSIPNQLNISGNVNASATLGGVNINLNGGLLSFNYPGGYDYAMGYNTLGAVLSKGLRIGNSTNTNTIQMASDITTNNLLNITGDVSVSNNQTYPLANSQKLATISYVNGAVGGSSLLGTNNTWTGTNAFNTSTPTTTITQTYPQIINTTQFSTLKYVNDAIASLPNTGAPIGSLLMWGGNTNPPTNYLFCSGQSISTTTYSALFAVIGYTYGGGGGNFTLPNFHNGSYGVMPIGSQYTTNTGVVQDPGITGNVQQPTIYNGNNSYIGVNQLAPHTHTISPPQSSYGYNTNVSGNTTTGGSSSRVTGLQTATFPTDTSGMTNFSPNVFNQNQAQFYPSYCSVMFIIKYI